MFQIFPSLKKVKVGSPRHFLSNNVRPTVPIFCKSFFGSKPATKLLKPVILFATFYMSRTVCQLMKIDNESESRLFEICREIFLL